LQPWGSSGVGKPPPWLQPQYRPRFTYQLCVRWRCEPLCCIACSHPTSPSPLPRASRAQQYGVCCPEPLQHNGCSGSVGSHYPCYLQLDFWWFKFPLLAPSQHTGQQGHEPAAPTSVRGKLRSLFHYCHASPREKSLPEAMAT